MVDDLNEPREPQFRRSDERRGEWDQYDQSQIKKGVTHRYIEPWQLTLMVSGLSFLGPLF